MIFSWAHDYDFYCSLHELEQVKTRLDNLTQIFKQKYGNQMTDIKCYHNDN